MGLPSKKQLNKHRRGTRKALDTLDALNEDQPAVDQDNKKSPDKKAVTTAKSSSSKKKKSAKPSSKKKPEKSVAKKSDVKPEQSIEIPEKVEPVKEPSEPVEMENADKKEQISLDFQEDNVKGVTDKKAEALPTESVQTDSIGERKPDSIQIADFEEDTQKDRYLSFRISKEDYGIEIKFVTEIIVMQKVTEVPNTPPFIKGVINLRGKVIPVMDVRQRFNLDFREYDERTCIVVVDVSDTAVGLIVDTVNEVIDIPDAQIDPPPSTYSGIQSSYISGMGKTGKNVKILLDVKSILNLT